MVKGNKKLKTAKIAVKSKDSDVSDENSNDNHSDLLVTVHNTRKRGVKAKEVMKPKKLRKKSIEKPMEEEEELDYEDENTDKVQFEEGNNVIQFELNEGESLQFTSDEEEKESENSETEEGELTGDTSMKSNEDTADEEVIEPQVNETPKRKVMKKSTAEGSVQEQVSELSETIKAMKEVMTQKRIFEEFQDSQKKKRAAKGATEKPKRRASGGNHLFTNESCSDTTIYKEVIEKADCQEDPEVSFKLNLTKRISSSSEEQVNTSDELMEVDHFIADCERNANQQRRDY